MFTPYQWHKIGWFYNCHSQLAIHIVVMLWYLSSGKPLYKKEKKKSRCEKKSPTKKMGVDCKKED